MKYHPHGSVLFVTFAVEEGIMLPCNPLIEVIIRCCLARALRLYKVEICDLIVEPTHLHLIVRVISPNDLIAFIGHFKAESAHRLNNLLGRKKRTIWCEGYDSPLILTPRRALIALAYLYANPAKDNLVDSIDEYPGFSTWKMVKRNNLTIKCKYLSRDSFEALPKDSHNLRGYSKYAKFLLESAKESNEFTIKPTAWMEAFGITEPEEQKWIFERLEQRIRTLEARARKKRARTNKPLKGRERLMKERINAPHNPNRKGRKMWCLSDDRKLRVKFITFLKELIGQAREVQRRWRLGDYSVPYPLGLYPPSMPKLAEPLGIW